MFMILSLFLITLVSAVPPITTEFVGETGFAIESSVMNYYKINEGACVQIFVFNRSNGRILTEDEVSCEVFLADRNGTEVLNGYPAGHEDHFDMCRPANIVTELGTYSLTMVCNDSTTGGYNTHYFEATENGEGDPTGEVHVFLMIFALFSFLFILYTLLRTLKDLAEINVNILTLSLAFSAYITNLALYYYLTIFMPIGLMLDISLLGISAFGITHLFLPLVGLIFSWIKKGRVD